MSVYSAKDFDSRNYNDNRPTYPDEFYEILMDYHQGPRSLAIDVGCGPGTATFHLASEIKSIDCIIGTDASSTMIDTARQLQNAQKVGNLSFEVSPCEKFEFLGPERTNSHSCDLITAAECAHWFNFEDFQDSAWKNMRRDGTIAVWGYSDALFVNYPDLDDMMNGITYNSDKLGPYWQQPGRNILRGMYSERKLDPTKFKDIQDVSLHVSDYRTGNIDTLNPRPLKVCKKQTIIQYANYIKSWSAYHSWKKDQENEDSDIVDDWVHKVLQVHPELAHEPQLIAWNTFYKFGRRL
ncbi:hypothetical protein HG535_0G04630 [Zygotorulaspora mrakii]|uniref:Methyltransferase domain-containing protein n=1 Tax=Zygotorulaspora mrakii TaxID=42260 RepID=A0A7H9B7R4_ZYGMR|nr:uncharacterized protein HG535_0G04630 [Zygotorulaspora mrakii]QLG74580.1 hypothetical protein HG535_0G04630 [Zygotorulaspora mrakii]